MDVKQAHDNLINKLTNITEEGGQDAVRDSQDNDPMTKYAFNVKQNDAGYLQFTEEEKEEDIQYVDKQRLELSMTNNLKNMHNINQVPKEELMLSKLVEQDEDLKNNILQIIL